MTLQNLHVLPGRWIPEPDGAVAGGRRQQLAIARECHLADHGGVALRELPGRWVPEHDGAFAREVVLQHQDVARERHRADPGGVALQCLRVLPGRWVPEPDGAFAGG